MREHEVPTHVQAEDRVLLGFTFPQIVAVVAVCALSYGAYRYAPVGPSEVRMAIAVVFGLVGVAMVVGKIGGRRLPLVAADLLKFRLGARVYAGPVSQLVRTEAPTPPQPAKSGPGPLKLIARKSRRVLRKLRGRRKRKGKEKERRCERRLSRPRRWFGKRGRKADVNRGGPGHKAETLESRRKPRKRWVSVLAVAPVMAAAAIAVPQFVLADGHDRWQDEIDFELTEPVEGRRVFVETLTISGGRAAVTLRAATALDIRVRAFGGPEGTSLRFWGSASLAEGESIGYSLPLHGPVPSFTVSWEDTLGQAGAITVEHDRIPYPLPEVEGELCDLRMTSLGWTPGAVSGVIESQCVATIGETLSLQTVAGHESVTETAVMDAAVTAVAVAVSVGAGSRSTSMSFVADGETRFSVPIAVGEGVHDVTIEADLTATLSIPIPPLTVLTHHPERTELRTETVSLWRPGASDSDSDSQTITVTHDDGTTTQHTVSAYAYAHVPGMTIQKDVTITIVHPEHIKAEVVDRQPIGGTRTETLALAASSVGSDDPFEALALPEPEPVDPPAEQEPAEGLQGWFERLGWEWPW